MSTATKTAKTTTAAAAPAVASAPIMSIVPAVQRPAYLTEKADEATGEVVQVSRFRYLPGQIGRAHV